jgi:hypothetical protein
MAIYDGTNAPTITVEIDTGKLGTFTLGVSKLGGTDVLGTTTSNWTALPIADVRAVTIRRGRTREDQAVQPGELTLKLDNLTGNYDPDNASSTYTWNGYSILTSGLGIRVKATYAATAYIIYTGYVERVDSDMSLDPVAIFTCSDALAVLARRTVSITAPQENTAARVGRVLDAINWSASDRSLTSSRTLVAKTVTDTALALCEVASTSEFGRLFASRDNKIVLQPYESLFINAFRVTLSDSRVTGTIEYDTIVANPGAKYLVNTAAVTDGTGAVTTATNTESVARYDTFQRSVTTQLDPTVSSISAFAQIVADRNALPATRVDSIDFSAFGLDATVWPQLLQSELGDNVTVERTTVDGRIRLFTSLIEALNHDITSSDWRVHMDLSPSKRTGTFIINTSLLGGSDTLWY